MAENDEFKSAAEEKRRRAISFKWKERVVGCTHSGNVAGACSEFQIQLNKST